jgi:hypothetical protein
MPFVIGNLIADPNWLVAVQQAIAVRALGGAVNAPDQTAARARLNRVLLASVQRLSALAAQWVTPTALNASITATYVASGAWVQGDVEFVVEGALIAYALNQPTDYDAITVAMADATTLHILTGDFCRAANDILADGAPGPKHIWVRTNLATPALAAAAAAAYVGLILTTPQLRVYGGDLTGVSDQEISDAIGAFISNWVAP